VGKPYVRDVFKGPFASVKRMKSLIIFYALTHVVFLAFGQWAVMKGFPMVLELRDAQLKEIQNLMYLKPLTGALSQSFVLKVLYTFFFNLSFGAFISTTATGVVFFLPYAIAVWRAFMIGMLIQGLTASPMMLMVFYTTFAIEFGAYCLSSAVGTDLGIALLWPGYRRMDTRKDALREVLKDGARLYFIIIIILFLGAVWEIAWLDALGPIIPMPEAK
jgi:hypothetical protein